MKTLLVKSKEQISRVMIRQKGKNRYGIALWPYRHIHIPLRKREDPNTLEFIYKKLCIYSYTFKLKSPSEHSPFDAIHLPRHFFHCSKQFLNTSCLLVLLPFFVSPLPVQQTFPFEDFFHPGKEKKVTQGESGWIGRVRHGVTPFLVKKGWTLSTVWAGALEMGKRIKSLQKIFTEAKCSLSQ